MPHVWKLRLPWDVVSRYPQTLGLSTNQDRRADKYKEQRIFAPIPKFLKPAEQLVCSKMFGSEISKLMLGTRPDTAYTVSVVSRFSSNAVQRIMGYLPGTIDLELTYTGELRPLVGYTDADWAGRLDTPRSMNGYVFSIGNGSISWSAKRLLIRTRKSHLLPTNKNPIVAVSSMSSTRSPLSYRAKLFKSL
jgi:hypothetical protein